MADAIALPPVDMRPVTHHETVVDVVEGTMTDARRGEEAAEKMEGVWLVDNAVRKQSKNKKGKFQK